MALTHDRVDLPLPKNVPDLYLLLEKNMLQTWQEYWKNNVKGRFYYSLVPKVSTKPLYSDTVRCKETLLSRLRFGKCFLADTLHLLGKRPDSLCDLCQVTEDVPHFLMECRKFLDEMVERNDSVLELRKTLSISTLLTDPDCMDIVFKFVKETGIDI